MKVFSDKGKSSRLLMRVALHLAFLLSVCTLGASAATRTWDGGGATNNWSEAANWSENTAPVSGDSVLFDQTSSKNATINTNVTLGYFAVQSGYAGTITQSNDVSVTIGADFNLAGGTYIGSDGNFTMNAMYLQDGNFQGGTGLIYGNPFGYGLQQSGGTFSSAGNMEVFLFSVSGGTFNAPTGILTVVADFTIAAGAVFNAGTGTVKITGYSVYNCANSMTVNVDVSQNFNNLQFDNQACNTRYVANGDTLIVNGDLRLSNGSVSLGRLRPLGTLTIDSSFSIAGSTIVEYLAPNRNFVINNPSSTVAMLPIEMNAADSTLTSSGAGKINFYGMTLSQGTLNQGAGVWDFSAYPGYAQSGGTFNGGAAQLNISNGLSGNILTGGVFNGGTGLINGGWGQSGGTFQTQGDMNVAQFTLSGGTFNAPAGTLDIFNGFTHTAGGTFNAGTGTVQTSVIPGVYGTGFDVNSNETFNNLKFNGTYNSANHGVAAGDTLTVNGTLTFNGRGVNGGSIVANGDVFYTNYGGYQNATTVVKFQDSAARTVTFSGDCTSYFQPTLVNNPNITINTGCDDADAVLMWTSLDLRQGTVNAGNSRSFFTGSFAQSGGAFNAGNNAINPSTSVSGDFDLSGGTFNAAPFTFFGANYTHTSGGTFNYGGGTVTFGGFGGTIDVDSTENFNHIRFEQGSTGTTKTIAAGDTIIANGNLEFRVGYVSGGTINAKKNVSVVPNFSGGSANLIFSGAADQIFTNTGGTTTNGTWTVNKPNSSSSAADSFAPAAPTSLLISGNIGNNSSATLVPFEIISGNAVQTGSFNHTLASLSVAAAASFINEYGGTLTLGGDVTNDGIINFNGNGAGCQDDSILLRSTSATRRNWNGAGYFLMADVDVSGQAGIPVINVYSGTNSGNNGTNWIFNSSCLAPTAANVTIGGRVLNMQGRGVANARIVLTDSAGASRVAISNPFGYYRFSEIAAGQTIVLRVTAKRFVFDNSTMVINAAENLSEVNFTAFERSTF